MSARANILSKVTAEVDGSRSEVVTVPEWDDEQVLVRAATGADKRAWKARSRKFVEVAGGYELQPVEDLLGDIFLVARCTFEVDGSRRVFTDDDVEVLAQAGESTDAAIARLFDVALRVSGFAKDDVDADTEGNDDPAASEATTA